jgi:predicted RecA/RadA family phage recombinase
MPLVVFIHDGNAVDYTPGSDVPAGAVVVQGELVGVAKQPIAAGRLGALAVAGVFDFPKATGDSTAIAAGAVLFWDAGDQLATTDDAAGANKRIGKAVLAAGDDDELVRARLNQ